MSGVRYNKEGKKRSVSTSAVVRLVIWSVVLCLLVGIFAVTMLFEWGAESMFRTYRYDDDGYSVGNGSTEAAVTDIFIDWVAGSVTVLATDGEEIRVTEDYAGDKDAHRLRWKAQNGVLTVKYCRSTVWGGVDATSKKLTVEIPRAMLEELNRLQISAVSAAQTVGVSARELKIRTVSGRVDARGDYDFVEIETVSGSVNFDGSFREGSVSGVSGDATIYLRKQANELDVETVSGGMHLILPADTTGFEVDFDTVSGKLDMRDFDLGRYGSDEWGDGSMEINAESVSGKLIIEKETKD